MDGHSKRFITRAKAAAPPVSRTAIEDDLIPAAQPVRDRTSSRRFADRPASSTTTIS
jgi:hypothetical protein